MRRSAFHKYVWLRCHTRVCSLSKRSVVIFIFASLLLGVLYFPLFSSLPSTAEVGLESTEIYDRQVCKLRSQLTLPDLYSTLGIARLCCHRPLELSPERSQTKLTARERFDSVPSLDGSHTARFRALSTHTSYDRLLMGLVTSSRITGVPLEILGFGWSNHSFILRNWFPVSYADAEGLKEDDVVMVTDGDIFFTGADLFPLVQEFVTKSPRSANQTDPLLVRTNQQMAPLIFGSQSSCVRHQIDCWAECEADLDELEDLYSIWSLTSSLRKKYDSNRGGRRNVHRFLNAGVLIGRVWAIRRMQIAFNNYLSTEAPHWGGSWYYDQGAIAKLYSVAAKWEVTSGLLSAEDRLGKEGPYGMIGGMLALDYPQKISSVFQLATFRYLRYDFPDDHVPLGDEFDRSITDIHSAVINKLHKQSIAMTSTAADASIVNASLSLTSPGSGKKQLDDTEWGVPLSDTVQPVIWHFAAGEKYEFMPVFEKLLPWMVTADAYLEEEAKTADIFWSADPVPVWTIDPDTLSTRVDAHLTIRRNVSADITTESLCRYATSQKYLIRGVHKRRIETCKSKSITRGGNK